MRKISNSEVSSWLACRNQYRYAFDLDLEPIKTKDTLSRGVEGHKILAVYYEQLLAGKSHEDAMLVARTVLQHDLAGNDSGASMDICLDVDRILQMYWGFYGRDN